MLLSFFVTMLEPHKNCCCLTYGMKQELDHYSCKSCVSCHDLYFIYFEFIFFFFVLPNEIFPVINALLYYETKIVEKPLVKR